MEVLPKTQKELNNLCMLKYRLMQAEIYEIRILFTKISLIRLAYGKSKDLAKTTQSDKVLRDKPFKIASDPK